MASNQDSVDCVIRKVKIMGLYYQVDNYIKGYFVEDISLNTTSQEKDSIKGEQRKKIK